MRSRIRKVMSVGLPILTSVFFFWGGGGGGVRSPTYSNLGPINVKIQLVNIKKILPFHWMSNLHMHIYICIHGSIRLSLANEIDAMH